MGFFFLITNEAFDAVAKKSLIIYGHKDFSPKFPSRIYSFKFYI